MENGLWQQGDRQSRRGHSVSVIPVARTGKKDTSSVTWHTWAISSSEQPYEALSSPHFIEEGWVNLSDVNSGACSQNPLLAPVRSPSPDSSSHLFLIRLINVQSDGAKSMIKFCISPTHASRSLQTYLLPPPFSLQVLKVFVLSLISIPLMWLFSNRKTLKSNTLVKNKVKDLTWSWASKDLAEAL